MSVGIPSPRTADTPMAFTSGEFLRGTVASWVAFNLLFALAILLSETSTHDPAWGPLAGMLALLLIYMVPVALVVSGIVTLLSCGGAWALALRLRRTRRLMPHVIGYAVLGAVIGAVVVGGYQLVVLHALDFGSWLALLVLACATAAPPLGWGWEVWRARRADAGLTRAGRADPDAAFEDAP